MTRASSSTANEVLLLDARLDEQRKDTYPDLSINDYFLVSSVDTILRSAGLSSRQIEDGIVDGTNDGGIDAVYLFVDGQLVEDPSDTSSSSNPRINIEIVQAKYENGFKEAAIQRLLDHLPLLLQLDDSSDLSVEFNAQVVEHFQTFRSTYLGAAHKFPELSISVHYVTKSADYPNEKVIAKSNRLKRTLSELLTNADVTVDLIGASVLNSRARERKSSTLTLPISEGPISSDKGGFVSLVSLVDYFHFITDDDQRLRDDLFEENVRDYEGLTTINKGIAQSLQQGEQAPADFWWLNNGVTIIGKRLQPSGKRLAIEDPQIVNGLQTSRSIYQHFHSSTRHNRTNSQVLDSGQARQILVRIIETLDETISAQIIKATNSQNRVSAASLRSAEPFQRDIEDYFLREGLFYERKKNHYKNLGKPREKIVEVLELAQAVGSILLQQPHTARSMPSALVRGKLYERVFSAKTPLKAYFNCLQVVRIVDKYLQARSGVTGRHDRSNLRFHLARSATAFALMSSRPRPAAVAKMDLTQLDDTFLEGVERWVTDARSRAAKSAGTIDQSVLAKGAEWAGEIDRQMSRYSDKVRWPKGVVGSRRAARTHK